MVLIRAGNPTITTGRIQIQTIRDALDGDAAALVVKEREYAALMTEAALADCGKKNA